MENEEILALLTSDRARPGHLTWISKDGLVLRVDPIGCEFPEDVWDSVSCLCVNPADAWILDVIYSDYRNSLN